MFTKAGFSTTRIRAICRAKVSRVGKPGWTWGILIVWPEGDWAWASSSRVCWGDQVQILSLLPDAEWRPSWPTDPRHGAQHWIEKGVAPDANRWQAQAELQDRDA